MQWPAFDAELTLLPSGKLLVSGPLGASTAAVDAGGRLRRRHAGALRAGPAGGTWVRGEVKLAPAGTGAKLPLEHGMWHFIETAGAGNARWRGRRSRTLSAWR